MIESSINKAKTVEVGANSSDMPSGARRPRPTLELEIFGVNAKSRVYKETLNRLRASGKEIQSVPPDWSVITDERGNPVFAPRIPPVNDLDRSTHGAPTPLDPRFLPPAWEMRLDRNNVPYFVSHALEATTYTDPRGLPKGWRLCIEPIPEGGRPCFMCDTEGFSTYIDPRGLPDNWELRSHESRIYFMDHERKQTSWRDPRDEAGPVALQRWLARDLVRYIQHAVSLYENALALRGDGIGERLPSPPP